MITKYCGKCDLTKHVDEFGINRAAKDGRQTNCKACKREYAQQNADRIREKNQRWVAANKERHTANVKRWEAENSERKKELRRRYKAENKEAERLRNKRWEANNPAAVAARDAARRAAKIQRTPAWLTSEDHKAFVAIYKSSSASDHIDHIIPLRGELVSGLHVPANLQVIPAKENLSKTNHFDPNTHEEPIWHS